MLHPKDYPARFARDVSSLEIPPASFIRFEFFERFADVRYRNAAGCGFINRLPAVETKVINFAIHCLLNYQFRNQNSVFIQI
jgi:hypothetical protein